MRPELPAIPEGHWSDDPHRPSTSPRRILMAAGMVGYLGLLMASPFARQPFADIIRSAALAWFFVVRVCQAYLPRAAKIKRGPYLLTRARIIYCPNGDLEIGGYSLGRAGPEEPRTPA